MSSELECDRILLLQADWDGELNAAESAAIQSHREECAACARAYEILRLTRTAARKLPRYAAPRTLNPHLPSLRLRSMRSWASGFALGIAASVATIVVLQPHESRTAQLLVDSHVRAAQSSSHLLDVVSTNQHVVKPWFDGRLSFSPPVKDLAIQGFPLLGARIDVIEGHSAAVLVYQAGRHQVDLFVWPTDIEIRSVANSHTRGFNLVQWTERDAVLTAVSDLNERELRTFAARWRAAQ
jgi:anti-sigma factor RsiW